MFAEVVSQPESLGQVARVAKGNKSIVDYEPEAQRKRGIRAPDKAKTK